MSFKRARTRLYAPSLVLLLFLLPDWRAANSQELNDQQKLDSIDQSDLHKQQQQQQTSTNFLRTIETTDGVNGALLSSGGGSATSGCGPQTIGYRMQLQAATAPFVADHQALQSKRIFCFYDIQDDLRPQDLNACLCSHVVYSYVAVRKNLSFIAGKKGDLRSLASLKRKNPNLKLLVSLRPDDYFSFEASAASMANESSPIISSPTTTTTTHQDQQQLDNQNQRKPNEMHQKFAKRVRDFIVRHSLDGINLDWSYFAQTISSPKEAREHLGLVLAALNDNFASSLAQSSPSSAYIRLQAPLITMTASRDFHSLVDGYDFHLISKLVDFVHLPAFDFDLNIDQYSIGHPARLHGISDTENLDTLVDLLLSSGLPSEQLVAGLPSHAVQITSKPAPTNSTGSPSSNLDEQLEAAANISIVSHAEVCRVRDLARSSCSGTGSAGNANSTSTPSSCWTMSRARDLTAPFAYDSEHWMGFDDETSIKLKAKYVLLRHLAGAALFTLNQDDSQARCGFGPYPLLTTINNVFARAAKSQQIQSNAIKPANLQKSSPTSGVQFTRAPHQQLTATSLMSNIFGKRPASSATGGQQQQSTTPSSNSIANQASTGDLQTSASEQSISTAAQGQQQQTGLMSFVDIIEKYHSINRLDGPTAASAGSDSSSGDELLTCDKIGYQRYPRDCSRFYRCVQTPPATPPTPTASGSSGQSGTAGQPQIATLSVSRLQYECPSGLVFDEQYQVCNWPSWSSQCSGSGEVNSITNVKFACPNYGYFQNQENCEFFYYCSDYNTGHSQAYQFRCPFELGFDEEKLQCNWKWLVKGCQQSSNGTTPSSNEPSGKNAELARKYLQKLESLDTKRTDNKLNDAVTRTNSVTQSADDSSSTVNDRQQPEVIASSDKQSLSQSNSEQPMTTFSPAASTESSNILASSSTSASQTTFIDSSPTSGIATNDQQQTTMSPGNQQVLHSYAKSRAKRSVESSKETTADTSGQASSSEEKDKEARAVTGAIISRFVSFFDSVRAFNNYNANRLSWLRPQHNRPHTATVGHGSSTIQKLSGFGSVSKPKMDLLTGDQQSIASDSEATSTKGASGAASSSSSAPVTKYPSFVGIPSQAIQSAYDSQSNPGRPLNSANSASSSKFLRVRRRQSAQNSNLPADSSPESSSYSTNQPYKRPTGPPSILSPFLPTSALYMVVDSIRAIGEGIGVEFNRVMRLAGDQMRSWFGVRPVRPLAATRRSSMISIDEKLNTISNEQLKLNALVQSIGGPGTTYSVDSQTRRIKRTKRQISAASDDDLQAEESQLSMGGPYASIAAAPAHISNQYRDPLNRPAGYPLNELDDAAKAAVLGPEPKLFNQPKFIVQPQMTPITQQEYERLMSSNMESLNSYMKPIASGQYQPIQPQHSQLKTTIYQPQQQLAQYPRNYVQVAASNNRPMILPVPSDVNPTQKLTNLVEQAKNLIAIQQYSNNHHNQQDHMEFAESNIKEVPFGMPTIIRPIQNQQQQVDGEQQDSLQTTTVNMDPMSSKKRRSTVAMKLATLAMPRFITGSPTPAPATTHSVQDATEASSATNQQEGSKKSSGGYMSFLPSLSNVVVAPARSFMSKVMDINKAAQDLISTLAPGMRPTQQTNSNDDQQRETSSNVMMHQQTRTSPMPHAHLPQIAPLPANLQQFQQQQQHQAGHFMHPNQNQFQAQQNQQQQQQFNGNNMPTRPNSNVMDSNQRPPMNQNQQHLEHHNQHQNQQPNHVSHKLSSNKTSGFVLPPQLMLTEQEAQALSAQLDQLTKEQLEMLSSQLAQTDQRANSNRPANGYQAPNQQDVNKNQDYALKLLKMVSQTSHNPEDVKLLEQLLTQLASPGSRPSELDHKLIEIGQADDQALLEMLGLIPKFAKINETKSASHDDVANRMQSQQQIPTVGLDGRQIMQQGAMRGLLVGHPPKQRYMQQHGEGNAMGKKRRRPESDYSKQVEEQQQQSRNNYVRTQNSYPQPSPPQHYKQPYIKQEVYKLPAPIIQNYQVYYPKPQPYYTTTTTTTTTTPRPIITEIVEEKMIEERPLPPVQQTFTEVIESNVTTPDGIETSVETRTKTAVSGGANFNVGSQVGLGMIPQPFGGAIGQHSQRHPLAPPPPKHQSPAMFVRMNSFASEGIKGGNPAAGFDQQKSESSVSSEVSSEMAEASGPSASLIKGTKSGSSSKTLTESTSSLKGSVSEFAQQSFTSGANQQQIIGSSQLNQVGGAFAGGFSPNGYDFSTQPVSQMEEVVIKKKFKPFPKKVVVPQTREIIEEVSRKQPIIQQITSFSSEQQEQLGGGSGQQQQFSDQSIGGAVGNFDLQQQDALFAQQERQQMFGFQQQQEQQQQFQSAGFASGQAQQANFDSLAGSFGQGQLEQVREDQTTTGAMSMTGQDIVFNRLLDEVKMESQNQTMTTTSGTIDDLSSASFGESSVTTTTSKPIVESSSSFLMASANDDLKSSTDNKDSTEKPKPPKQAIAAKPKKVSAKNTAQSNSPNRLPMTTKVPIIETTRTIDNNENKRPTTVTSSPDIDPKLDLQRSKSSSGSVPKNSQKKLTGEHTIDQSQKSGSKSKAASSTQAPKISIKEPVVANSNRDNSTTSKSSSNNSSVSTAESNQQVTRRRKRKSRSKKGPGKSSSQTNIGNENSNPKAMVVEHMATSASDRAEIVKNRPAIEAGEHVAIYGTKSGFMPILRPDDPSYMILHEQDMNGSNGLQETLTTSDSFISSKHQSPNLMSITQQQQKSPNTKRVNVKQLQQELSNDHTLWKNFVRHRLRDQISVVNLGNITGANTQATRISGSLPISLVPVKLVILPASPNNQILDKTNWNYLAAQYPQLFPLDMKNVIASPIDLGSPSIKLDTGLIDESSEALRLSSFGRQFEAVSRLIEPQTFKALDEIIQRSSGQLFAMQAKITNPLIGLTIIAVIPDGPLIKQRHLSSSDVKKNLQISSISSKNQPQQQQVKNDWSYYQRQLAKQQQQEHQQPNEQSSTLPTSPRDADAGSGIDINNSNGVTIMEQISKNKNIPGGVTTLPTTSTQTVLNNPKTSKQPISNNLPQSHKAAALSRAIQESIQGAIRQHYDSMKNQIKQSLKQHTKTTSSSDSDPISTIDQSKEPITTTTANTPLPPKQPISATSTPPVDTLASSASESHSWSTPEAGALANLDPLDASGSSTEYSIIDAPKKQSDSKTPSSGDTNPRSHSSYEIDGVEQKSLHVIDISHMNQDSKLIPQKPDEFASYMRVNDGEAPKASITSATEDKTSSPSQITTNQDNSIKNYSQVSESEHGKKINSSSIPYGSPGRFISIGSHLIASPKKLPKIVDQAYVNHFYDHISDQPMSDLSPMDDQPTAGSNLDKNNYDDLHKESSIINGKQPHNHLDQQNNKPMRTNSEELLVPESACTRAGLFQHPFACNKFYECFWDKQMNKFTLHMFECPIRLAFDERIVGCSMPIESSLCVNY